MLLLLSQLLAAAPAPLVYGYREDRQTHARTWEVTDWSKPPRVWVATPAAPLRERPAADAPVVAELHFGAPVKVLQVVTREPVPVGERTDRWYRVACDGKAGYLFGDAITSARFEDDFDGDGEPDLATVAFTAERQIRVRFFAPKDKRESFVDVAPSGGEFLGFEGGYAWPEAVTKAKAGVPLVHVDTHVEACSTMADYWVSDVGGAAQIALHQYGLIDPPNLYTYQVELQGAKKRALVHHEKAEEEGQPNRKWTEVWTLDGGVFVGP